MRSRIVVVGGTSGIGRALARDAARRGAEVLVTGRDPRKLEDTLGSAEGPMAGHVLDTADEAGVADFFAGLGPYDHLVSMVGGFMGGGFLDAPLETIRRTVDGKFVANLSLVRAAAPTLRDGGSIVLTAGSGGRPHEASGAIVGNDALRRLVEGLAVELAPRARVNAVAPTWTRTGLYRDLPTADVDATEAEFARVIPLGRTATVDEVAAAYLFLVENTFVTGHTLVVDGGVSLVA